MPLRNNIRNWLLRHPKINPYRFSFNRTIRILTSPFRIGPDFIIIGSAKCGTTSLFDYLSQHPSIVPASKKEVNFFDYNFDKGYFWYKSHFPTFFLKKFRLLKNKKFLTGEASPLYIFNKDIAQRVYQFNPNIKIILLLRNPVERAYSHYYQLVKNGSIKKTFEESIDLELEQIMNDEFKKIYSKSNQEIFNFLQSSNLQSGIYVDQIKNWTDLFPKKQFLIIHTYDLEHNLDDVISELCNFLNLPNFKVKNKSRQNVGRYPTLSNKTKDFLINFYVPHNQRLYDFLGLKYNWDN